MSFIVNTWPKNGKTFLSFILWRYLWQVIGFDVCGYHQLKGNAIKSRPGRFSKPSKISTDSPGREEKNNAGREQNLFPDLSYELC